MYNIWGFLLQTISVSIVAAILLIVKHILADKLSPRWQYGAWILLMFRIIIPINPISYIIPELPVWIETAKAVCEKQLVSNYTSVYEPISLAHVLPIIDKTPQSITDWLFVIYALGIIICLLRYMISYISLRVVLRQGTPEDGELEKRMLVLCESHELRPCRIISVNGITSAFICGVFRPILVVPAGMHVDDKILLHELLHLKYWDTLQNIGWCILRSLHWCNPFIQYAIYRIENDMESLCDQRVLERLEGEERRAYGTILLAMANSKYARIPGTSSISNGGKNISRRITAIVRFKKYPKGMALVSVCIVLILFSPSMIGNASTFGQNDYEAMSSGKLVQVMAVARVNRCTTVAGALDTYAKGLLLNNGVYIASASSLSKHQELESIMCQNAENGNYTFSYFDAGEYTDYLQNFMDYSVCNLTKISENQYSAILAFQVDGYEEPETDDADNTSGYAVLLIPVNIMYEDAWVVEETAERSIYCGMIDDMEMEEYFPYKKMYYAESETGTVKVTLTSIYSVDNIIRNENSFLISTDFDYSPKTDAGFYDYESHSYAVYECNMSLDKRPENTVGIVRMELDSEDGEFVEEDFFFENIDPNNGDFSGGSNNGYNCTFLNIDENWDGMIEDGSGGGSTFHDDTDLVEFPAAFAVRIYWDGEVVDELVLKEVTE